MYVWMRVLKREDAFIQGLILFKKKHVEKQREVFSVKMKYLGWR